MTPDQEWGDPDYDHIDLLIDTDPIELGHQHREALAEIARHHQDFQAIRDLCILAEAHADKVRTRVNPSDLRRIIG